MYYKLHKDFLIYNKIFHLFSQDLVYSTNMLRVYYFTNGHVINQAGAYLEIFIRGRFSTGLMMFLCIFCQAFLELCVHFVLLLFITIGLIPPGSSMASLDPKDEDEDNGKNLARLDDGFWSCHGSHVVFERCRTVL